MPDSTYPFKFQVPIPKDKNKNKGEIAYILPEQPSPPLSKLNIKLNTIAHIPERPKAQQPNDPTTQKPKSPTTQPHRQY
uniref:Uncharacterized protein n=1 Tax=Psilocybe cubensis TaxID=181762 RepID=A0A8H8CMM0_PSICU